MATTTKKTKLLFVPSWYVKHDGKEPSVFLEEYAEMFANGNYDITVLHVYMKGTFLSSLFRKKISVHESTEKGMHTLRIGVAPFVPVFRTVNYRLVWFFVQWCLKKKLNVSSFDIINSHSYFIGGYIASRISKKHQIPIFHTEHFSGFLEKDTITDSEIKIFLNDSNRFQKLVVVSEFFKRHFLNFHGKLESKIEVIPNFIQPYFKFEPIDQSGNFKFLAIGVNDGNKNLELLIESWKIFTKVNKEATLTLLGSKEESVKNYFYDRLLPPSINIIPTATHIEVARLIQEHHCTVSTSKKETFGLSVLESLACGRPVVTTDSGGVLDFVNESNSIISDDIPFQFAEKMQVMINTYARYNLQEISQIINEKYSTQKIFLAYNEMFQTCLSIPKSF